MVPPLLRMRTAVVPAFRSRKRSVPGLIGSGLDEAAGDKPCGAGRENRVEGEQLHAGLQRQRGIVQLGELRVVFVGEADAGEPEVAAAADGPENGRLDVRGEDGVGPGGVAGGREVEGLDKAAGREAVAADVAGHAAAAFERRDPGVDGLDG